VNGRIGLVEKDIQQRAVDLDVTVVFDVSGFAKSVHEYVYPRAGAADDGGKSLLTDLWDIRVRLGGFAEVCHVKESAGQPFLGGIEELIDEVVLNAARALEQIGDKELGHPSFIVQNANHFGAANAQQDALCQGSG